MPTSELVGISGSGVYVPRKQVTVRELAESRGLNYEALANKGIQHIAVASDSETELFMAQKSALQALSEAKVKPSAVDVVIYAKGITHQKGMRSFASQLIESMKLERAYGFDIDAGFLGGLIAIHVANNLLKSNPFLSTALVVAAQEFDELYLFDDDKSRVRQMIFGDGAAACVLSLHSTANKVLSSNFTTDHATNLIDQLMSEKYASRKFSLFRKSAVVKTPSSVPPVINDRIVSNTVRTLQASLHAVNLDASDVSYFVKTQLTLGETAGFIKKMNIPSEKIVNASTEKGYLGQADVLANLHHALHDVNLQTLDVIALIAPNYDCSAGTIIIRR